MSDQEMRKIAEAGLKAANALAAHTLKVARPLFWHIGVRHGGVPKGAPAFILQFEKHFVAVTADHVIEAYLADLAADSRTICQLGTCCRIWPEKSLIARNARLDIATFDISPNLLADIGAVPIDCRGRWPPPNVEVGDTLTLTGFLDNHRSKVALNRYDMQAWGGHVIAEAVSERDIVTIYEPERVLQPGPVAKPPLGFNMSGCSGGPAVLIKQINGLLRWFPVGLIYKGPDGKAEGEFAFFDRIHIRRLHFLRSDGTIDEPDIGWLPG